MNATDLKKHICTRLLTGTTNSKHRTLVTPARRGKNLQEENKTPEEKRRAMSWAQRLKRVSCDHCGGSVKREKWTNFSGIAVNHTEKERNWIRFRR